MIRLNYTGYVRQIDSVGRLVLPMDMRMKLGLTNKAFVEFFIEGSTVVLRKYHPACVFCDSADDIVQLNEKNVCKKCIEKLNAAAAADPAE